MLNEWRTAIVKPIGNACNLRCRYCFYNQTSQTGSRIKKMSDEILERFIAQFMILSPGIKRFIWHGGEPMLAGLDFFQRAMRLQKQHLPDGSEVVNHIQTNGTLINDEWALFFKEHSFKIGVSLDGDRESHNRFRRDAADKGSFDRVMRGISFLRQHSVKFGMIATLTRDNLSNLERNFDFIRALGVGIATNDYEISSSDSELGGQGISSNEASEIWSRSLDWWLEADDPNLRFRSIDNIVCGVMGRRPKNCSYNGTCHHYFCLHSDGEVYPCDRLSQDKSFCLGNLKKETLEEILSGNCAEQHAQRAHFRPPDCQDCDFLQVCNNGCTALRDSVSGKFVYCESRKRAFTDMAHLCSVVIESPR